VPRGYIFPIQSLRPHLAHPTRISGFFPDLLPARIRRVSSVSGGRVKSILSISASSAFPKSIDEYREVLKILFRRGDPGGVVCTKGFGSACQNVFCVMFT